MYRRGGPHASLIQYLAWTVVWARVGAILFLLEIFRTTDLLSVSPTVLVGLASSLLGIILKARVGTTLFHIVSMLR